MTARDAPAAPRTLWTIGHSTREWDAFTGLLRREGIEALVDVRAFPGSRRHPHFDRERMAPALEALGVRYHHVADLGGRRRAPEDGPPTAWRNASFHAYATWMRSPELARALDRLLALAQERRTAVMCSEAVPWRCHRNLIADAALARGARVLHIGDPGTSPHALARFAEVRNGEVFYPAESAASDSDGDQLDLSI